MTSNELRMPFAEWLFKMSEARVPSQERELAIYAVAFKVTTNEELAALAGMDTRIDGKSIADKTYNLWKKRLLEDGWVILKAVTIGRTTTIEVFPAFEFSPVTFTDMKPKDTRRFYGRNSKSRPYGETVEVTDVEDGSPVEDTEETRNSYVPAVASTAVSCVPALARLESSLREDSYALEVVSEVKEEEGGADAPSPLSAKEAFDAYNVLAQRIGLPLARTLTPQRRKSIQARMREHGGIAAWHTALANIERSAFLQGSNDREWRASLDFLIDAKKFTKVVEGTYGNGAHAQPKETELEKIGRWVKEADERQNQGRIT